MTDDILPDSMISLPVFLFAVSLAAVLGVFVARRIEPDARNLVIDFYAVTVPIVLLLLLVQGPVPASRLFWSVILISGLTALFSVDAKTRMVPDLLTIPMIALGLVHAAIQTDHLKVFAITSIGVVLLAFLISLVPRKRTNWIGAGDVLLFSGAMAWFGPGLAPDLLVLTGGLILLWYLAAKLVPVTKRPKQSLPDRFLPLAPALGTAQMAIWMGGPLL